MQKSACTYVQKTLFAWSVLCPSMLFWVVMKHFDPILLSPCLGVGAIDWPEAEFGDWL